MRITRIAKHPRRERARIHVDGEDRPRFELALDLLLRSGLGTGDTLEPERLAALEREDAPYRAREAALRLLAHRPRSGSELRQRLARRGVEAPVIESTMSWLSERGYMDDRAFAESFVRDRIRLRPRGRHGLVSELRRRGVDEAVAAAATDSVLAAEGVDEGVLAATAARSWARRNGPLLRKAATGPEDRQRARRRLYGHLARRGFDGVSVRDAIAAVLGD